MPDVFAIGIDPGEEGGAVLLDAATLPGRRHRALAAWWWRPKRSGGYLLDVAGLRSGQRLPQPSLGAIGAEVLAVAQELPGALVVHCEGQFTGQHKGVQSTLTLARAAGKVVSPLEAHAAEVAFPTVRQWRPAFRISTQASGKAATRHAVRLVSEHRFPQGQGLVEGLGHLAQRGHVAEAALIAVRAKLTSTPAPEDL